MRRDSDLAACVDALAEVHRHSGYPANWPADPAAWLSPPYLLGAWVSDRAGRMGGHVALASGVDDAELVDAAGCPAGQLASVARLFVRPGEQGRRLGEHLLGAAGAFASARALRLVLDVVDEPGSVAVALYERLGWQLVTRRPAAWVDARGAHPQVRLYLAP